MVVTRSQSDRTEAEEQREAQAKEIMANPGPSRAHDDGPQSPSEFAVPIVPPLEIPTERRIEAPSTSAGASRRVAFTTTRPAGRRSPTASRCSASTALRMRQAERDAEERMLALQRKELELERQIIQLQLNQRLDTLEAEGSQQGSVIGADPNQAIDQWLDRCAGERPQPAGPSQPTTPWRDETSHVPPIEQWLDPSVGERPQPAGPAHPAMPRGELEPPAPPKNERWMDQRAGMTPQPAGSARPATPRGEHEPPAPPTNKRWSDERAGVTPQPTGPLPPTTTRGVPPQSAGTAPPNIPEPRRGRSPTPHGYRGMEELAHTLQQMSRPQTRHPGELPAFSGAPNEWLAFKAAVRDSVSVYRLTEAENLQRLRNSLRGEARDAVSALLHTATSTEDIMKTLEQSFGRPEVIIDRAIDDLKRLPRPGSSASDLNKFAVKLQNTVCVLQSIDRRGYLHNPLLAREVIDKLSPHVRSRWCDYAATQEIGHEPEIVVLSRFLMKEADVALRYTYMPNTTTSERSRPAETRPVRPTGQKAKLKKPVYAVTEEKRTDSCPSCRRAHALTQCADFRTLSTSQRWEFLKRKGLCFRCIDGRHRRTDCKAKVCGIQDCTLSHHRMLHEDRQRTPSAAPAPPTSPAAPEEPEQEAVLSVASITDADLKIALLKVCPVIVAGPSGEVEAYALLDEGATVSLIDEALARSIGAEGPTHTLRLCGVNMAQEEQRSKTVTVTLRGAEENVPFEVKARTVRNLRMHEQVVTESMTDFEHLRDLKKLTYPQVRPKILVGADHWELIVSRELRIGEHDQPAASHTQLGWVLHGTVPRSLIYHVAHVLHTYTPDRRVIEQQEHDRRLHELVEAHFKIDALGVTQQDYVSDADKRATKMIQESMRKIDGGYEAGLPWKRDDVHLPPSYGAALRRLRHLEKKMDAEPAFAAAYAAEIHNLITKGYAEPCDGSEQKSTVSWMLPHFPVFNPNKPGKLRLVFDAAHCNHGVSLNDQLLDGPDLLQNLQGILFRFREGPVAVCADIQEMFLRIKVRHEDQPAQQFLWRGMDRINPPKVYKMKSMIFGAASSPFMAHSVRNHNAREHAHTHPRALAAITQSHYMDDLVDSYPDPKEARLTIKEVREVHQIAGFNLRGWSSNIPEVLRDVPEELRATSPTSLGTVGPEPKILGLYWACTTDELGFNTAMHRVPAAVREMQRAPTKREALSAVMSIYDPLGLLSLFTIRAKIILQQLWRLQMGWDEAVPEEDAAEFNGWLRQLGEVTKLRLPRHYGCSEHVQLHVLCDASEQAYAAAAYWRTTHPDGTVEVVLVAAKAKVAPRRTQTIPRLELQAAVLGARLAATVREEHRIKPQRTTYWTDSSTVVQWIKNDARRYTPFVAHRLGELAETTRREEWRWLPTDENVADDATRQSSAPIRASDRWFVGPAFLRRPEEDWPKPFNEEEEPAEVLHLKEQPPSLDWLPDPARFSKYETLVRTAARVLAFVDICRRRDTRMEASHLERAERALLRRAQEEDFAEEIKKMKSARPLTKASRLYRLDPVMEEELLRVRGRINASAAPADTKRPIILDGRHIITQLLVEREHAAAGHANRERVTNDVRQRYWVLRLRPAVRAVEKNCTYCRYLRRKTTSPPTGDLPRARMDPFHRPFTNTGVDYFGPMNIKIGRRREKRWGALFTCLTTRAVHLELVSSLTTDSAIMALRRMAARRGWPSLIYSDNGTNFRGADAELRAAYEEWGPALHEEGLRHRTTWRFIPPGAPSQGGAWERIVRSVKVALQTTLREKVPTEEVLRTLLTEAEHSINARPLTHVSVDARDPEALTPNHFLLGSSLGLPTTGTCEEADRRTWRASQALADQFWRRWVREYLPSLVPRGSPTNEDRRIHVGDVVVVADSSLPRNVWPLGIVERTYPGPDGGVRVADVKTKSGVFRRPASRLAVLMKKPEEARDATPGGDC